MKIFAYLTTLFLFLLFMVTWMHYEAVSAKNEVLANHLVFYVFTSVIGIVIIGMIVAMYYDHKKYN